MDVLAGLRVNKIQGIQPDQGQHSLTRICGFEFWLCSQSVGGFILILIGLLSSDLQSGEAQGW